MHGYTLQLLLNVGHSSTWPNICKSIPPAAATPRNGIGIGNGNGIGIGIGSGDGNGNGIGSGSGAVTQSTDWLDGDSNGTGIGSYSLYRLVGTP